MDHRKKVGGQEKKAGQMERVKASGTICGSKSGKESEIITWNQQKLSTRPRYC